LEAYKFVCSMCSLLNPDWALRKIDFVWLSVYP